MISLLIAFAVLVAGYLIYSRVTQKVFDIDDRKTPAIEKTTLPRSTPKVSPKRNSSTFPSGFGIRKPAKRRKSF